MESQRNYETWPLAKRSESGLQGLRVHLKDPTSLLSVALNFFQKQMEEMEKYSVQDKRAKECAWRGCKETVIVV